MGRDQQRLRPRGRRGRRRPRLDQRLLLHHARQQGEPEAVPRLRNGQHLKEAKLAAVRPGKGQQEFLTWTFSDVLVTAYQTGGTENDASPRDQVSLNFAKIKVEYRAQKADGSLDAADHAGWDAKANKKL